MREGMYAVGALPLSTLTFARGEKKKVFKGASLVGVSIAPCSGSCWERPASRRAVYRIETSRIDLLLVASPEPAMPKEPSERSDDALILFPEERCR